VRDGSLIPRFGRARRDPALAVLEGFHPLKHALRFGAELEARDERRRRARRLAAQLAPELREQPARAGAGGAEPELFDQLAPIPPTTGVMALAERPTATRCCAGRAQGGAGRPARGPRDLGNMGACVRVAAAADAAGVLSTGSHDPWHPDALRGAAGLHFALPVGRLDSLDELAGLDRPPAGAGPRRRALDPAALDPGAVLAFGTERHGLSDELLERADARISIPMRPGVSSLNLATSVAAVLFAWRLSGGRGA
jgi:TrmH family RNA methyltransferase